MPGYHKLLCHCGGSLSTGTAMKLETACYCYLVLPFQPGGQCYLSHYRHAFCAVLAYGPMRFKHVMSMPVLTNGKEMTEPIEVCIGLRWYGLTETTRTACRSMGIDHLEHDSLSLHSRSWIHQTRYAIPLLTSILLDLLCRGPWAYDDIAEIMCQTYGRADHRCVYCAVLCF
jgi:hypothetical protein